MKTLANNVLVYDEECPLCRAYTHAFVKTGMLEKNGRQNYTTLNTDTASLVDMQRAKNEIALVDTQTKQVTYGIDSLFMIIGHSFPLLASLFYWEPFRLTMRKLYSFVSYNRRVIICGNDPLNPNSCRPDFHLFYRVAYLLVASFISSFVLLYFTPLLGNWWPLPHDVCMELLLVLGQLVIQSSVLFLLKKETPKHTHLDYLGNLITISLMGSLLLLPTLLIHNLFPNIPAAFYLIWFAGTVTCMFSEHARRIKVYKLPLWLCFSWASYRGIVCIVFILLH